MLTLHESAVVLLLALTVLAIAAYSLTARSAFQFWNPLLLFAAVYAYYFLIGPLIAVVTGNTILPPVDYRQFMISGWIAGLIGLWSTCLGFFIPPLRIASRIFRPDDRAFDRRWPLLFIVAVIITSAGIVYVGSTIGLNPFSITAGDGRTAQTATVTALSGYLTCMMNGGFLVIALALARGRGRSLSRFTWLASGLLGAFFLVYAKVGFRGRIVVAMTVAFACFYLLRSRRPSLWVISAWGTAILIMASAIVLSRAYFSGLDLEALSGVPLEEFITTSFQDSVIFFTLSLVVETFPVSSPFIGFQPVTSALVLPIPRELWPNKPTPDYLLHTLPDLTGTGGQAVPNIGEYYMAFGWIGVVVGCLCVGWVYRNLWQWFKSNSESRMACIVYSIGFAMIFPLVSRGYLGQYLQELFFGFGPAVLALIASPSLGMRSLAVASKRLPQLGLSR